MEKMFTYLVLLLFVLAWLAVYEGVPELQGLLTIVSICGVALAMRCRQPMEGK